MDEIRSDDKNMPIIQDSTSDEATGKVIALDDHEVEQFYGSSTTQAYRLKSELVGKCMEQIGMGKYVNNVSN